MIQSFFPPVATSPYFTVTPTREIVHAISYAKRTGTQWRNLSHDVPKWQLVTYYFYQWRKAGIWERRNTALRRYVREQAGRKAEPTAGSMDPQSVKTIERGGT